MPMYQHGFEASFLAKRATGVQKRKKASIEGFESSVKAPENVFQLLDYRDTVVKSSFGDSLRFMLSKFEGTETSKERAGRTLWNPIFSVCDERSEKRERGVGRAWQTSGRKQLIDHLEKDGDGVWAARTPVDAEVRLGCLAALLQLNDSGRYSCSL